MFERTIRQDEGVNLMTEHNDIHFAVNGSLGWAYKLQNYWQTEIVQIIVYHY